MSNGVFQGRASLIDRLIDEAPKRTREPVPLRTLSRKRLRESVRRDLSWLFNTRTPLPGEIFDKTELTVIDFGIPDFGRFQLLSGDDRMLLERRLKRAIEAFEPRLRHVRVRVEPQHLNEKALSVLVQADLVVENVREPVSFRTLYDKEMGEWRV